MKRGKPAPGGGSAKKAEKPITSFFFKQPSPAKAPAAKPSVVVDDETSASPPSKRRRGSDQEPFAAPVTQKPPTPVKPESEAPAVDAPATVTATRYAPAVAAVTAAALASIAPSQPDRHDRFVRKLALDHRRRDGTNRGGAEGPSDGATEGRLGADGADAHAGSSRAGEPREESHYARRPGARPSASTSSRSTSKMTPLEEQVSRHKAEHPGVLLLIEVGYKFHFYGEDARVAAKTLNIFAYQSRNYLTASVPVPRLHVYVRRLVDAGHKVGVIRQTETAALKAAGEYANDGTGTGKSSSLFERKLVGLYTKSTLEAGVAVDPSGGTNDRGETAGAGDGLRTTGVLLCVAESFESSTSTRIGLAAIDASTGDVRHAEFDDTQARSGLEARLLQLSPAEVLLVEPVSAATARLVAAVFGEGKGARVERVAAASGYADARDAEKALERYGERGTRDDHGNDASLRNEKERKEREESLEADGERRRMNDAPPVRGQTARAVATAFDWLKQFGLDGVSRLIRENAAFAPLAGAGDGGNTMRLSPNVIRQLELFRSSEDTHRGSLVWLLSANALTAGGARLCRSWVAHPLTDAREIRERLGAVRELAETAEPDSGGRLETLTAALRRCHGAKNAGDAERYLARVFHGTATPAELVLALGSISAFAGAVAEMAERAKAQAGDESHETKTKTKQTTSGFRLCVSRACFAVCSSRRATRTSPRRARLCSRRWTPRRRARGAPRPPPRSSRTTIASPTLEGTRKAVADAIADLNDLLPELRDALVRGAENASTSSGAGKQKTLSAKLGGATKGAVSLVPASPGLRHRGARRAPHRASRVSRGRAARLGPGQHEQEQKGCAVPPAGGAGARRRAGARARTARRRVRSRVAPFPERGVRR
jgi:DNA mismatch repair protein MSH3